MILTGRIGVALSTWDRATQSHNLLGLYKATLMVDGTTVFVKTYDEISYSINSQGAFDYIDGGRCGGRGTLSVLYRREGNHIDFYDGEGVLNSNTFAHDTIYTISINAEDYHGNSTNRSFKARFNSPPQIMNCTVDAYNNLHVSTHYNSDQPVRLDIFQQENNTWRQVTSSLLPGNRYDGSIELPDTGAGNHRYRVSLTGADSSSSAVHELRILHPINTKSESPGLSLSTELSHDCLITNVRSESALASLPLLTIIADGDTIDTAIPTTPLSDTSWIAAVPFPQNGKNDLTIIAHALSATMTPVDEESRISFHAVDKRSCWTVCSEDELFAVDVTPASLYRPAPVTVTPCNANGSKGLKRISQAYNVTWGDLPLQRACVIRLDCRTEVPEKSALFVSQNGSTWRYLSNDIKNGVARGEWGGGGIFGVFNDPYAPYVSPTSPAHGSTITNPRPIISARIQDSGSGIAGSGGINMSIDNIPIYGEYDYEAKTVSYRLHNPLASGKHTVTLSVSDRLDNTTEKSWQFTVK